MDGRSKSNRAGLGHLLPQGCTPTRRSVESAALVDPVCVYQLAKAWGCHFRVKLHACHTGSHCHNLLAIIMSSYMAAVGFKDSPSPCTHGLQWGAVLAASMLLTIAHAGRLGGLPIRTSLCLHGGRPGGLLSSTSHCLLGHPACAALTSLAIATRAALAASAPATAAQQP